MPPTRQYSLQCHGKRGYITPNLAQDEIQRSHKTNSGHFNVYFCPWCRQWHVGHRRGYTRRKPRL